MATMKNEVCMSHQEFFFQTHLRQKTMQHVEVGGEVMRNDFGELFDL